MIPTPELTPDPERAPFLEAILDAHDRDPEDPATSLVHADWLEENGDLRAARRIRLAVRLEQLPPDHPDRVPVEAVLQPLQRDEAAELQRRLPPLRRVLEFRRGLPWRVALDGAELNPRRWDALLDRIPAHSLKFERLGPVPAALVAQSPRSSRIREIELADKVPYPPARALLQSNRIQNLQRLVLDLAHLDLTAADALPQRFPNLRALAFRNQTRLATPLQRLVLRTLLQNPLLRDLRELALVGEHVLAPEILLESRRLPFRQSLRTLRLNMAELDDRTLERLRDDRHPQPPWPEIQTLELASNRLADSAAFAFLLPRFPRLRELDLAYNLVGDLGFRNLLEATAPRDRRIPGIRRLALPRNAVNLESPSLLRTLPDTPGALLELDLADNALRHDGLRALVDSPILQNLQILRLDHVPLGDAGARILADARSLANLRRLEIQNCGVAAEGAWALARSPNLPNLRRVHLDRNPVPPRDRAQILETLGAVVRDWALQTLDPDRHDLENQ